jgi:predicted DNA-binding transcriptional regulator YafY
MPANKYALLRYRIIDRCIGNRQRPFPDKEALRQACEDELYGSSDERISLSTIEKDIYAMRNESNLGYYAPIAYSKTNKGYYYEDPDYTIDSMPLSEEDVAAIHLAASTLRQFRGIPLFKTSEAAIDKILDRLSLHPSRGDADLEQYVQFETAPSYRGGEYLPVLLDCIQNRKVVEFEYEKYTGSKSRKYTLYPYLLKEYRNRWYIIGMNPEKHDIATFGLDRITAPPVALNKSYEISSAFNSDLYFKHSIGITSVQEIPQRIHLRFTPLTGKYVESQPLHQSQQIIRNDEVALEIELFLSVTKELLMQIHSYGSDVEVKAPESLRKQISNNLERTLKQYN